MMARRNNRNATQFSLLALLCEPNISFLKDHFKIPTIVEDLPAKTMQCERTLAL